MSYSPYACSCINCKFITTSANIGSHHHKCTQFLFPKFIKEFEIQCIECNKFFKSKYPKVKFCGHSCAATNSNNKRISDGFTMTSEIKSKIAIGVTNYHGKTNSIKKPIKSVAVKPIKIKPEIVGQFTKIHLCTCKICSNKFYYKSVRQYCDNCNTKSSNKRSRFKFRFNLYDFPNLFDLELLSSVGFYGPGGKSKRWNIDGLSRDHKVSVSDALLYNYDPFYISHPLNCELMPHRENDKKKGRSSIAYIDLIKIVDEFENNKVKVV